MVLAVGFLASRVLVDMFFCFGSDFNSFNFRRHLQGWCAVTLSLIEYHNLNYSHGALIRGCRLANSRLANSRILLNLGVLIDFF